MNIGGIPKELSDLLNEIDVSDSNYEKAVSRYESISKYIRNSEMKEFDPDIYLQGSFKLGTAIRPLTDDGAYDIDIVCSFQNLDSTNITQYLLKANIGKVIKRYAEEKSMKNEPEDGNRCWTITYSDESNFHVDILPATPQCNLYRDGRNEQIAITDKRNANYRFLSYDWEISNPKGYSRWFREQSQYEEFKRSYALLNESSIETVPYYKVKTPLQRIIQILKRHAEIMFENEMEYKPSSIIITTLAAKAYPDACLYTNNFFDVCMNLIKTIHLGIETDQGKPCVFNPVNREEILSNKWRLDERYYESFEKWITQIRSDINIELGNMNEGTRVKYLERSLKRPNLNLEIIESLDKIHHHKKAKWIVHSFIKPKIRTTYYQQGFLPKNLLSGQAISKNRKLKFEVIAEDMRKYDIYWQITNTGPEAENAKSLRGDFYESEIVEGKRIRKEETYFLGHHYVEAYLVKDDICYGKSEPFEVNIVNKLIILR